MNYDSDREAARAGELLVAARARLPWLKRIGLLPGSCPEDRAAWQTVFSSNSVTALWPELCSDSSGLITQAQRLVELGAEILIANDSDAEKLASAGILAPVFTVRA